MGDEGPVAVCLHCKTRFDIHAVCQRSQCYIENSYIKIDVHQPALNLHCSGCGSVSNVGSKLLKIPFRHLEIKYMKEKLRSSHFMQLSDYIFVAHLYLFSEQ